MYLRIYKLIFLGRCMGRLIPHFSSLPIHYSGTNQKEDQAHSLSSHTVSNLGIQRPQLQN